MEFTIQEMWHQSSGPVRVVLVMLLLMLILCIWVAIERIIALFSARAQSRKLAVSITELLSNGQINEAGALTNEKEYERSYLGHTLSVGLVVGFGSGEGLSPDLGAAE